MKALPILDPKATGIDVGSEALHVSIGGDTSKVFGTMTKEIYELRDWLQAQGVRSVAVEATGVYWLCLYEVLEGAGIEVLVVNGRHVKNLPGRKTDMADCQWLATLHAHGLLRTGFVPPADIRRLQDYLRLRQDHITMGASHVQHMQKALTQMNIQLTNVLADVVGETGQKILRAIVAGERDGHVLAALRNVRVRASAEEIAKSLQGNWRTEHLFALKQALDAFDFVGTQLAECDREIELQLQRLQLHDGDPAKGKKRGRARNAPKFDLRTQLFRMCGVDLTRIDGVDVTTALAVVSEIGTDMARFATVKHFTSWLGLCPGTKITGGKVMSGKTQRVVNRAAQALRLAAAALRSSKSALGAYFRRLCSRMDKPKAVTAAAHKLARLIYSMLTKGE
ncbi:MAG: IS110 family transposase, partial [Panacagrimonas sp.]